MPVKKTVRTPRKVAGPTPGPFPADLKKFFTTQGRFIPPIWLYTVPIPPEWLHDALSKELKTKGLALIAVDARSLKVPAGFKIARRAAKKSPAKH